MYRYVNLMLAIEKENNETDEKAEQRLREKLVSHGFSVCYPKQYEENYSC